MVFPGKAFDEITVGETFGNSLTVSETHIVMGCGMFGDFNPLHSDESYCQNTQFKTRILHGPLTSALMSAPIGVYFAGTTIAYLEHNSRFKAPVKAGDTLSTTWTITEKLDKPKLKGGIAILVATCHNQDKELIAEADGKIMLRNSGV
jgi:3-hydroxybutyryl-CoA dehydratase